MRVRPNGGFGFRRAAQVVLLANLYPADAGVDELDSHMYQTVGHTVVEAYAQCCGLPMLRRRIRGAAWRERARQG